MPLKEDFLLGEVKEDFLLGEVAEAFHALATCILQPRPSAAGCEHPCQWRLWEWLLLLHSRSEDVLAEFSGYYCFRLLVDADSPLATYFIDLFYQLEWLLENVSCPKLAGIRTLDNCVLPLPEDLCRKAIDLGRCIRPAVTLCRHLFWELTTLPISRSFYDPMMKREAKPFRDFAMDNFRSATRMLSFVNLDRQSDHNRVELGKKLGEGGYAAVYKGNFVTRNNKDQTQRIAGEPVAVKVFTCRENWAQYRSAGPSKSDGYQSLDQKTERMQKSEEITQSSSVRTAECGEMCSEPYPSSYKSAGSHFFDQMEKMLQVKGSVNNASLLTVEERLLSEELWKLVSAKHPNIVMARGYIGKRLQGESGLVMELMSTSLQKYLEQVKEPLEEPEMVDLMLEVAKGMRYLHECDLVHKDLKPQNILLRSCKKVGKWDKYPAMEVKLADFGLTQRILSGGDVQRSGIYTTPVGTYCYMAPEVLHRVDYQTSNCQDKVDVFSYGTTCFNILTCKVAGALEFTHPCSKAKFYEAVKTNEWRAWVKGKPEYLIELIARCWDLDPSRRPTFANICSLLQRAMLCILTSPIIKVRALSDAFATSRSEHLYYRETMIRIRDAQYPIKGTLMMDLCLNSLTAECSVSDDSALSFLKKLGKVWSINTTAAQAWPKTRGVISKLLSEKKTTKLKRLTPNAPHSEIFAVIDEANSADGSSTLSSTAIVHVELRKGGKIATRFFRIPLTAMDLEWVVPQALACTDGKYSYRPTKPLPGEVFPFHNDDAKTHLSLDESLAPFLMCFFEEGYCS